LTFEHALVEAGVPLRNVERDTMISMFVSNLACAPAGRFHGLMVVTMRPIAEAQVDLVRELSSRYLHAHGAPVHVGDPEAIGITDLGPPDYGEPAPIYPKEILASAAGSYWTDQLNNTDQLSSYERMGEEIWEQASGQVGAFVQSVGTCGSLRGISTRLRVHNEAVHIVAVEPEESAVPSGRPSGSHKIEGTGAGFVVPLWTGTLADEIQTASTQEAMATARRLARLEGIFAGTSTGANVAVALRVAERLGPDHTVITVAVDSGMKYLSTGLYAHT
jgi:cysteine synthase